MRGVKKATARLADGTRQVYWYAWRGGPRLDGEPGSAAFLASYNAAIATKKTPTNGTLQYLIDEYQRASEFTDLAERTRFDYAKQIKKIEARFSDLPLKALDAKGAKHLFRSWRDELAQASKRQADYAWTVCARILSWSKDRGLCDANPCEKGGRIYRAARNDRIWTDADEAQFMASAPPHVALAMTLALWTGQRQGDLLKLTWSQFDGEWIRIRQGKGGARVAVPVGAPLKAALAATKRRSPRVLVNLDGIPWTPDGFRVSWRKAVAKAGIVGLTFHDLRGSAVTRLALAGASVPEIATITGHSIDDVNAILDAHYLSRDPALAVSAIRKLERRTILENGLENGPSGSVSKVEKS